MRQGQKTQSLIIETANDLFYHQGYGNTSIADIQAITGLSKGNITYHFKNKQDILAGVVSQRLSDIEARLKTWEDELEEVTSRLIRFCDILVNEQESLEQFGCPMGTLISEFAKNEPALYEMALPMLECFKSWLAEQFSQLGYREDQAHDFAMELLARVQGISIATHAFKDTAFLNREVSKLKRAILRSHRDNSLLDE